VAREQRLVFGEVASEYQQARPSYPDGLYDAIVELSGITAGDRLLEVGAGTGKATEAFVARGFEVTAVEPTAGMAAVLRSRFPDVSVIEAGFEDAGVDADAFAVVAAAQSWHWVHPVRGAEQVARALRPGGWLTLFWNRADLDGCEWHDALQPIYARHAGPLTHEQVRHKIENTSRENTALLFGTQLFDDAIVRHVRWEQQYTTAAYVSLLGTYSDHRMLPDDQRKRLHAAIADELDARGGLIDHPYVTDLIAARVR
jgi:SAM-dependent methyltransferase